MSMTGADPAGGAARYAVYFAPARGSAWWQFGANWLGRDDAQPGSDAVARGGPQQSTAEPARYGFHATLKAPFRLAANTSVDGLCERLQALAATLPTLALGVLEPRCLPGFVALVPTENNPALVDLAARCVVELDHLRAPLTQAEIQRRRPERLGARGQELLRQFGYPHVLERFRFHMTLALCDDDDAPAVVERARAAVAPLNRDQPLCLDRLCLFEEPRPEAPLRRLRDFTLGG
jgi:hypothetical protein